MKDSRFKLGINYTDRPSVIIPIRITNVPIGGIGGITTDIIRFESLPKSPLSPPEIHSPEMTK